MIKILPVVHADIFYKANVGSEEQRLDLLNQAWNEYKVNSQTLAWTNRGCWRSNFEYTNIDWLIKEVRGSIAEAGFYYQKLDPIYTKKVSNFTGSKIKYWTNINKPGGKNALHEHKLWHYVAVYYLDAAGTGDIVFYNPSNLTEGCNPFAPFVSPIAFSPKNGDLLVWPAWLPHEVEHNFSDKHRVNIAMNIRFEAHISTEDLDY